MSFMMNSRLDYRSVAEKILGRELPEPNADGWCNLNCPFHDDRRPSFGLNILSGVFHCFCCGSGNFREFLCRLGVPQEDIPQILKSIESNADVIAGRKRYELERKKTGKRVICNIYLALWMRSNRGKIPENKLEKMASFIDKIAQSDVYKATAYARFLASGGLSQEGK